MARPLDAPGDQPWVRQSLTRGAAGTALLHIERAHAGDGSWHQAHTWIRHATTDDISATDNTGLYQGAPAVAFTLHTAAADTRRYHAALTELDAHLGPLAHKRASAAQERITRGTPSDFREYDVFFGLTGIGALLLRRHPGAGATERVLTSLVELTKPLRTDDGDLPGWWVTHDPHHRDSPQYPRGHANFGVAHGIAGPLALLSHALRRGITVDGHHAAIHRICTWFDRWRQESDAGPWWPEWITMADLRSGRPGQRRPGRPSWCYGTPGITYALQSAGIALGDRSRAQAAEDALARCLTDPMQQGRLTDAGLCHGWAGLYQTVWRAARAATAPALAAHLPEIAVKLARHARPSTAPGLLEGDAGTALALHTAAHDQAPTSGWDTCLLLHA
nr:lanthionine synthetase C family protein [Streptomyces sp. SID3343]